MMRLIFAALAAITLCASPAAAQDAPVSVNINFGYQYQKQDLSQSAEFSLYDETGTWDAAHSIRGGALFDLGGSWRVLRNLSVGASYTTRSKHTRDVTVTANVPSPAFTDTFRTATAIASDLEHSERALHFQALWHVPVTVEFDVTLFGGPTFFSIRDELVESLVPSEVGGDFSSVNVAIATAGQRNSTLGFNLGIDTQYWLMRNVGFVRDLGVGAMLRYSHGSTELTPSGETTGGELKVDAGGLEIGAGLRFRF